MRTILVKWGGSLVTDKATPQTARPEVLQRLARELAAFLGRAPSDVRVVLGHGSGSFGHAAAHGSGLTSGAATGDRESSERDVRRAATTTQLAAAQLHGLVHEALVQAGVSAFGLRPGSLLVADDGTPKLLNIEPLERALNLGCVALVHGDVVVDRSKGFTICSTERVLECLAAELVHLGRIEGAIWLGETAGLLDENGSTILEVSPTQDVSRWIRDPRGVDVTGGMTHRIVTVRRFASQGVASILGNGLEPGLFGDCLDALVRGVDPSVGRPAPAGTSFVDAQAR